jgi:hypothetical protein
MMKHTHLRILFSTLIVSTISCRPVMTVGWQEILILAVIIALLFGPILFRLYRRWDEFRQWKSQDKKKD